MLSAVYEIWSEEKYFMGNMGMIQEEKVCGPGPIGIEAERGMVSSHIKKKPPVWLRKTGGRQGNPGCGL